MKTDKESVLRCFLCGILLSFVPISNADQDAHLEPLPISRTGYEVALYNSLLGKKSPHLFMIVAPSLKPQYAIFITSRDEYEESENSPWTEPELKSRQWFLEYVSFKHRLMCKRPVDPMHTYDVDLTNDIERKEIDIDDEFSSLMTEAWLSVLRETRYPSLKKRQTQLDGTIYIFKCDHDAQFHRYYGMTDSSSDVNLVELGLKLVSLAKSKEEDKGLIEKQCLELASHILKKEKGVTH